MKHNIIEQPRIHQQVCARCGAFRKFREGRYGSGTWSTWGRCSGKPVSEFGKLISDEIPAEGQHPPPGKGDKGK